MIRSSTTAALAPANPEGELPGPCPAAVHRGGRRPARHAIGQRRSWRVRDVSREHRLHQARGRPRPALVAKPVAQLAVELLGAEAVRHRPRPPSACPGDAVRHRRRAVVRLERRPQAGQRVAGPRGFTVPSGQTKGRRDLLVAQPLSTWLSTVTTRCSSGRRRKARSSRSRSMTPELSSAIAGWWSARSTDLRPAPDPPALVVAGVDQQAAEPGLEPGRVAQAGQLAPGPDERLLGGVASARSASRTIARASAYIRSTFAFASAANAS